MKTTILIIAAIAALLVIEGCGTKEPADPLAEYRIDTLVYDPCIFCGRIDTVIEKNYRYRPTIIEDGEEPELYDSWAESKTMADIPIYHICTDCDGPVVVEPIYDKSRTMTLKKIRLTPAQRAKIANE
ncbi:MAG TPA: hypothetical protein PK916_08920 [Bacteroidota bacterium]|nr:hypothetical protein [Bacteroidota bacterium]